MSAYLDLRPETTQNPQVRTGQVVLRDSLRAALEEQDPHTPEHESLSADEQRVQHHVEEELLPGARGAAVFACSARGLFESVATAEAMDDDVRVEPRPRIVPLARLADRDAALVALADTNTLRLFALRSGSLIELGLLDEDPAYKRTEAGGWSQARYQRHVDEHRGQFAKLSAEAIEHNLALEGATVLVLAGDEVALPVLSDELSKRSISAVRDELRIDMRASLEDINELCLPVLERIRVDDTRDAADRVVGATEADGMGVVGVAQVRAALQLGQVMELIVEDGPDSPVDADDAEEFVRAAVRTAARVRFIGQHELLRQRGGLGALLRFRLDRAVDDPVSDGEMTRPTLAESGRN